MLVLYANLYLDLCFSVVGNTPESGKLRNKKPRFRGATGNGLLTMERSLVELGLLAELLAPAPLQNRPL